MKVIFRRALTKLPRHPGEASVYLAAFIAGFLSAWELAGLTNRSFLNDDQLKPKLHEERRHYDDRDQTP